MATGTENRKIRRVDRAHPGCGRHPAGKAEKCTAGATPLHFLTGRFSPVINRENELLRDRQKMEAEFTASLGHLALLYGFTVPDVSGFAYPQDILQTFQQMKQQLFRADPKMKLAMMQTDKGAFAFATYKMLNTDTILYYIPLLPLWDLWQAKDPAAPLMASVMAYLYQVAEVSSFTEPFSYLYSVYESLEQWWMEDERFQGKEHEKAIRAFRGVWVDGRATIRRLKRRQHVEQFKNRCQKYKPSSPWEKEFSEIANAFYDLYRQYPHRSLHDGHYGCFEETGEDYIVSLDQYLSFMWGTDDCYMTDILMEEVNCDLQEASNIDEPVSFQLFDEPQEKVTVSLDFEATLFTLVNKLSCFLNYTNEKYNHTDE